MWALFRVLGEVLALEIAITIEKFPLLLIEQLKTELARHAECNVYQIGGSVRIVCKDDVVKCMVACAVADKFCINLTEQEEEFWKAQRETP